MGIFLKKLSEISHCFKENYFLLWSWLLGSNCVSNLYGKKKKIYLFLFQKIHLNTLDNFKYIYIKMCQVQASCHFLPSKRCAIILFSGLIWELCSEWQREQLNRRCALYHALAISSLISREDWYRLERQNLYKTIN